MDMLFGFSPIITAFIAIFVIMDPFTSVPAFLSVTKSFSEGKKRQSARIAALVAACVILFFLLAGPFALSLLGISLESFQIGGGVILLLMGISFTLGFDFHKSEKTPVEAVIIGAPLLSGPGVILTSLLLANSIGILNVLAAAILSVLASYLVLLFSARIFSFIGKTGLEILSRVMGILLAALAIEFIRRGMGF